VISVPEDSGSHDAAESGIQLTYGNPVNPSQGSGASDVQVVQSVHQYLPPGSQQADVQGQDQFINPQDDSITSIGQATDDGAGFPTQISDINQMQYVPQTRQNGPPISNVQPAAYSQHPAGPAYVAAYPQAGPQIINAQPPTFAQNPSPAYVAAYPQAGPQIFNSQPPSFAQNPSSVGQYVATYPQYASPAGQGYVEIPRPDSPAWGIQGHSSYPEIVLDYNPELRFSPGISSYESSFPSYSPFSSFPSLSGPSSVLSFFKNLFSLNNDC
jgi:hypothetical protein